jgi:Zn-dependent protease with chaperone function
LIYNNLLYLFTVILIFSTSRIPEAPQLSLSLSLAIFIIKAFIYYRLVHKGYRDYKKHADKQYFALEQRYSILAIFFFAIDVYLLDCKYYLSFLSVGGHMPALINLGGLALFFSYLSILWAAARQSYQNVFGRHYSRQQFIVNNIKLNLPIVLPWLIINIIFELLQLLPIPALRQLSTSQWGEPLLILLFFIFLAITFPALIKQLWGCEPLPPGPARHHMEEFCRKQNFRYSDIMLWPLYEGKMLTAGVMGLSKRFRYLLITPSLLDTLTTYELEAVLAHEIGHIKKYHLQLYLFLFLCFGLVVSLITQPLVYFLLSSNFFYKMVNFAGIDPEAGLTFWGVAPMFLIMLVYFRYIFGFFMRNFERQADLHVFKALGDHKPLVSSLEKIGWLSGNIRDQPSWHHFGIAQRVDFLEKCSVSPKLAILHDRKVYASLLLFIMLLAGSAGLLWKMPMKPDSEANAKFVKAVLLQRARKEPHKGVWHRLIGDLNQELDKDLEAVGAYDKALALEPVDPETLNNFAWLLVTSHDQQALDAGKALTLAMSAASQRPTAGYILDTLAAAYWANGRIDDALDAEREAMARDPANRAFYRRQMDFYLNNEWPADLKSWSEQFKE